MSLPVGAGDPGHEMVGQEPGAHVLGAIIAGGESRRFGAEKAFAEIGGEAIVERVRRAMTAAVSDVVLITNEPDRFAAVGLRARHDLVEGAGPLAGIHTALLWARELGNRGALCIACDMPFVPPDLLQRLVAEGAEAPDGVDAVAVDTGAGVEPLCAVYSVSALPEIERRLHAGELALTELLHSISTRRMQPSIVREIGDPEVLLMNVNTPADHRRAIRADARS